MFVCLWLWNGSTATAAAAAKTNSVQLCAPGQWFRRRRRRRCTLHSPIWPPKPVFHNDEQRPAPSRVVNHLLHSLRSLCHFVFRDFTTTTTDGPLSMSTHQSVINIVSKQTENVSCLFYNLLNFGPNIFAKKWLCFLQNCCCCSSLQAKGINGINN